MTHEVTEAVFNTHDNVVLVSFKQGDDPFDFTTATRVVLEIGSSTIDETLPTSTVITTTAVEGQLKFALGGESIVVGSYSVNLTVYAPSFTNGQVLACKEDNNLIFIVKDC